MIPRQTHHNVELAVPVRQRLGIGLYPVQLGAQPRRSIAALREQFRREINGGHPGTRQRCG
jgi:hypothetical protein